MRHQPCYGLILLEALRTVESTYGKGYIIKQIAAIQELIFEGD
jgi:hypothetical protein